MSELTKNLAKRIEDVTDGALVNYGRPAHCYAEVHFEPLRLENIRGPIERVAQLGKGRYVIYGDFDDVVDLQIRTNHEDRTFFARVYEIVVKGSFCFQIYDASGIERQPTKPVFILATLASADESFALAI